MNLNFNVVKKPDKKDEDVEELEEAEEIEQVEEELEDTNDSSSSNSTYDPKKKMFKFMGIIVGVMIILLIVLFLISSCSRGGKSHNYSYSKIEKVLKDAGKSYFKDHPEYLPQDDGDTVEVEATTLANEGKMRELSYYTDKNCTASVQVDKSGKSYLYVPNLNCGDDYSTMTLFSKVLNDNEPVTTGYGLYAYNGGYAFRGETVNNYVQLKDYLWRIVKIDSDNNLVLITADVPYKTYVWDNRYNETEKYTTGINNYSTSRIKELMDEIATTPIENDVTALFSKSDLPRLATHNLCIGKRKIDSVSKNNSEECTELFRDQKVGLLTLSDYLYASIDPNCKAVNSESCQNYNYLVVSKAWWLMTASKDSTASAFMVRSDGTIKEEYTNKLSGVRPVIYLNEKTLFKSGKGTFDKPYTIR